MSTSRMLLAGKQASLDAEGQDTTDLTKCAAWKNLKQLHAQQSKALNMNDLFKADPARFDKYK